MARAAPTTPAERVDERDTMFARMARRPGTEAYAETYQRRPDLRPVDDRLRSLPPLLTRGGRFYEPHVAHQAEAYFQEIESIEPDEALVAECADRLGSAGDLSGEVKELAGRLGAVAAGIALLDRAYVYTHKGRLDEDYGRPVDLDHPRAVVFLVEMDFEAMQQAPRAAVILESARQYHRAAEIAKTLQAVLERAGWQAKAHYDAHYDIILPPLAVAAGLGEVGRNNILVAHRFGSRVRIGAVTTDCPLSADQPVSLGVQPFCEVCKKCAENCPSRSLSLGGKQRTRGVTKWFTEVERCYAYWRSSGTDCGICMAVCPFSHRNTLLHNFVRWVVRVAPILHRPAVWLDDLVYGRHWKGGTDHDPTR
jgi:reductive dehalogenase